jgi:GGDEF domain-containing protein
MRDRAPLIVNDARIDPNLRDNPAVRELDVIAYAGIPLLIEEQTIGALCVIRARLSVERLSCPPVDRITISIGVAELTPGETTAAAIERADERLYQEKDDGRNRVRG